MMRLNIKGHYDDYYFDVKMMNHLIKKYSEKTFSATKIKN